MVFVADRAMHDGLATLQEGLSYQHKNADTDHDTARDYPAEQARDHIQDASKKHDSRKACHEAPVTTSFLNSNKIRVADGANVSRSAFRLRRQSNAFA